MTIYSNVLYCTEMVIIDKLKYTTLLVCMAIYLQSCADVMTVAQYVLFLLDLFQMLIWRNHGES